jgi:polyketide cyclase/dehydrase/lipid transport protein
MARYLARIPVPIARSAAFTYLSRFDRAAEWDPGVEAGEMLTPEPVGVASQFQLVAVFLGRRIPLVYEIVEYDRNERIALRAENGSVRSVDIITFEDADDGCVVVYDAKLDGKGLRRLADPLLALVFKRIGDRATTGLRARLSAVQT